MLHRSSRIHVRLIAERIEYPVEYISLNPPAETAEGTIRKEYALSIGENSVHGSDAPEPAAQEIAFWFSGTEIVG